MTAIYCKFYKLLGIYSEFVPLDFCPWRTLRFNYNPTTMGLNRLGQMSLLAIESYILESILLLLTNNDVIDYFSLLKPRKFP